MSSSTFDFSPPFHLSLPCSPPRCAIPWICPIPSRRQKGPPACAPACLPTEEGSQLGSSREAAVEILFDFSTRKKWLQRTTKPTYNKRAARIYFGLPSIPSGSLIFFFFFPELAKSFLLIASIVSAKNCFWMTSINFSRMLLICSHGAAFPMAEFRSQPVRNICTANPSLTPQSHMIIIPTST